MALDHYIPQVYLRQFNTINGVDGFTATSGRKVYTIHFVPTTSSTTNITFRAFVNVTNYK